MLANQQQWKLDQEIQIGPQLFRILHERIVRNDLKPGSQISEAEIASAYEVSRQPVREAFIKLAEEGLITIRPQRSTLIKKITFSSVLDARFIREAVEAEIVKILAQQSNAALIMNLRAQLETQKKVENGDQENFLRLDDRFHRTLAEAAGQARVWKFVEGLKSQLDRVRYISFSKFPIDKIILQHVAVVDAIEKGDTFGADIAIRHHMREILDTLPHVYRKYPHFFTEPTPDDLAYVPNTI